jgi:hypothetical protein
MVARRLTKGISGTNTPGIKGVNRYAARSAWFHRSSSK